MSMELGRGAAEKGSNARGKVSENGTAGLAQAWPKPGGRG
jgi:hypothetical protein